jgi:hypothetical protein
MLAYIFWHRPVPDADRARYEDALTRFQAALVKEPPPGFIAATSYRIEAVPWLGGEPGYEDWCLLDGSWAMDPLNAVAITGSRQGPHDAAAALNADGAGGLYAHAGGEAVTTPESTIYWLTRPRGIQWQPAVEAIRAHAPRVNVWRRQMVLGPASEFAVEVPEDTPIEVPPGWQSRAVKRVRVSKH